MESTLALIATYPVYTLIVFLSSLGSILFVLYKFRIKWKGGKPVFEKRSEIELMDKISTLQVEVHQLKEKLQFSHSADFFKKTENGEYIGYSVAKKPYVEVWCDGNWTTEEYHDEFDRFERLWDAEDEIIIYGKNPNIPSDLYHIIEKKAKILPSLTIFCSHTVGNVFVKYFADFTNVKVVQRS